MNKDAYTPLFEKLIHSRLAPWLATLPQDVAAAFDPQKHGKLADWQAAIAALPILPPASLAMKEEVALGKTAVLPPDIRTQLTEQLLQLHPWRKGPYQLFDLYLDTEWRSDWKWDRVRDGIEDLNGRFVLDVGCGNGYHLWRMLGEGARLALGLDPFLLYVMQFWAIRRLLGQQLPAWVLPLGVEAVPPKTHAFDTIFSMGVLYHRRSPFDHLFTLRDALRSGGQLVLETLIIEGGEGEVLVPRGRYAKMRNVWFIPSLPTLVSWLKKCHLRNVQVVDVTPTAIEEQRSTGWMTFHSLANFLDQNDPQKTIEGYPAPIRATLTANA